MVTPPEHRLIERAQQGDPDAIAGLYRQYVQAIARYIAYRVPDEETVEDLTADVFLRMVEGLPGYQVTGAPFEAWLPDRRHPHRRFLPPAAAPPVETLGEGVSSGHTPLEMTLQERERADELRAALAQLGEEQQTILILRFVEAKNYEVAGIVGKVCAR